MNLRAPEFKKQFDKAVGPHGHRGRHPAIVIGNGKSWKSNPEEVGPRLEEKMDELILSAWTATKEASLPVIGQISNAYSNEFEEYEASRKAKEDNPYEVWIRRSD